MPDKTIFKPKRLEGNTPKETYEPPPKDFSHSEAVKEKIAGRDAQKEQTELEDQKAAIQKLVAVEDAKKREAVGDKRIFYSKCSGLKIIIRPRHRNWDKDQKRNILDKGKHIKFKNSCYITGDPEEIKFLEEFSARKPREVFFQNPKAEKLLKALAMVEAEESATKGKQGAASGG